MNLSIITGNLTKNPVTKVVKGDKGDKVVLNGTLAHNDPPFVGADGQKHESTVFMDFEAWGGLAQTIEKHITTKRKIQLSGRLKQNSWTDEDGSKHSRLVLVADQFEFMDSPAREPAAASA